MKPHRWALLLPLICVILQGGHTVVSKMSASVISPEAISHYRWVVAVVVIAPFLTRSLIHEWPSIRRYFWHIALLSLLGMVAYQGLVYLAAKTTSATNIAIIGALAPLVSVGWAIILLGYRPGRLVLLGCALSLVGVVELVQKGHPMEVFSHTPDVSDLYVLAGVALYSLYGVLIRKWKLPIPPNPFFFAHALFALAITAPGPLIGTATPLNATNGMLVLIAGLIGSATIPFLWMKSVQSVGPVASSVFTNLTPLITAAIAVTLIGEQLALYHAVGAALIIGGVALAQAETLRESVSNRA